MKRFAMSFTVAASAVIMAACSSGVKLDENAGKGAPVTNGNAGMDNSSSRPVTPVTVATPDPLNDPTGVLAKRSVYFDYDKFDIKPEYKELVAAHAKYLAANKGTKILIQGNTDERGSREYNLALGQKRSDAVKKALSLLGVREEQLESVSLGEEKPKAEGNDETAYAENRRADILYSGEF